MKTRIRYGSSDTFTIFIQLVIVYLFGDAKHELHHFMCALQEIGLLLTDRLQVEDLLGSEAPSFDVAANASEQLSDARVHTRIAEQLIRLNPGQYLRDALQAHLEKARRLIQHRISAESFNEFVLHKILKALADGFHIAMLLILLSQNVNYKN